MDSWVLLCTKEFFVSRCCHRYHSQCQICRWAGSVLVPPGSLQRLNLEWKKTKQQSIKKNRLHSNISPECSLKTSKRTIFHNIWQLVVFKQGAHIVPDYPTYDGVHIDSSLTQPEIKVSKPENLVESGGDVSCNQTFTTGFNRKSHKCKYNQSC